MLDGFCQSVFNAPTELEPSTNRRSIDFEHIGPCNEGLSDATKSNQVVAASVSLLLRPRRPHAVFWFVSLIIIFALQAKVGGSFAHVGNESRNRIPPTLADFNASASIPAPAFVFRVVASGYHICPNAIRAALRNTMRRPPLAPIFASDTSATCGISSIEGRSTNATHGSATASANPITHFAVPSNDCVSTKDNSFQFQMLHASFLTLRYRYVNNGVCLCLMKVLNKKEQNASR